MRTCARERVSTERCRHALTRTISACASDIRLARMCAAHMIQPEYPSGNVIRASGPSTRIAPFTISHRLKP